jgi:hypothetical protein
MKKPMLKAKVLPLAPNVAITTGGLSEKQDNTN